MIHLVNGRGQLGEYLKSHIPKIRCERETYIYHTWRPWQVDHDTQEEEYKKFTRFVDDNKDHRILFISTYSQNETHYVHYKQMSEAYLISNCADSLVIRLPSLVGNKGILKRFRDEDVRPYGKIEFMTLKDAADKIVELVNYDGIVKSVTLRGEPITAALIKELITQLMEKEWK